MKNDDINNKPKGIFVIAIIFILGGLAGSILVPMQGLKDNVLFFVICLILLALGIVFFVYAYMRLKSLKASQSLLSDPSAIETTATFVRTKLAAYTSKSIGINKISIPTSVNVYKKIVYDYVDEQGISHRATSVVSYFTKQAKYLQEKGTFKIRCKGKNSIIIEEVPEVDSRYNIV